MSIGQERSVSKAALLVVAAIATTVLLAAWGCRQLSRRARPPLPARTRSIDLDYRGERLGRFSVPELAGAGRPRVEVGEADEQRLAARPPDLGRPAAPSPRTSSRSASTSSSSPTSGGRPTSRPRRATSSASTSSARRPSSPREGPLTLVVVPTSTSRAEPRASVVPRLRRREPEHVAGPVQDGDPRARPLQEGAGPDVRSRPGRAGILHRRP